MTTDHHHLTPEQRAALAGIIDGNLARISEAMLVLAGLAAQIDDDLSSAQDLSAEIRRVAKRIRTRSAELQAEEDAAVADDCDDDVFGRPHAAAYTWRERCE